MSERLHYNVSEVSFEDMAEVYDSFTGYPERLGRLEALSLDSILQGFAARRVLDCACGTGVQTLGLLARGYEVCASDISPTMVSILRKKARARGLNVQTRVADFRNLAPWKDEIFDAVICAGNSLSVLRSNAEALQALRAMKERVNEFSGAVVLGLRNYPLLRRLNRRFEARAAVTPDERWFDIRFFGAHTVEVVYLRVSRSKIKIASRVWAKKYRYLDPEAGAMLLRQVGFPFTRSYEVKGLRSYDGGEWGFAVGSWTNPT